MKKVICLTIAASCMAATTTLAAHNSFPNFKLHGVPKSIPGKTINEKSISRTDAKKYWSEYYAETRSNTQYFKMPKGSTSPASQSNVRIEAYAATWTGNGRTDHTFEANYYIAKTGSSAAIFQFKSPKSTISWGMQLKLSSTGKIYLQPRGGSNVWLFSNQSMKGKSFKFKFKTNGDDYTVYINDQEVYSTTHPYYKSGERYGFRWGIYTNNFIDHDNKPWTPVAIGHDIEVRCWDISFN